jgi:hypothetical protein
LVHVGNVVEGLEVNSNTGTPELLQLAGLTAIHNPYRRVVDKMPRRADAAGRA